MSGLRVGGNDHLLLVSQRGLFNLCFFKEKFGMKKLLVIALLALASGAQAESTAAKKELVAKVLLLQQPAIEQAAQALAEQPAAQMMQQAGMVMQTRVAADKREAMAKEIQTNAKKYADEAVPLVRERAVKLAPSTIGTLLEEKFTEDELKQLIAIFESPVNRKYSQMGGEMRQALMGKLIPDVQGLLDPKLKSLDQTFVKLLGLPAPSASAAKGTRPPAKAASK